MAVSPAPYRTQMRASMLAIANRVMATEGLPGLQARRIAAEAGCAVGTLYNVFGGLDFLIIEANASTLEALGNRLQNAEATAADRSTQGRLTALALAYLGFAVDHNQAWRSLFDHHMTGDNEVPGWYRERQWRLFAMVEGILEPAIADARERSSNARALFSAVHGIVSIALDRKLGDLDLSDTARQIEFLIGAIARGINTFVR